MVGQQIPLQLVLYGGMRLKKPMMCSPVEDRDI